MGIVQNRLVRLSLLSMLSVIVLGITAPILSAEENEENILKLESVTVTAEKREEDLQKVTASTSVISDITIEDAGIQSTRDLRGQIPNFKTVNSGSRDYWSIINIRGISNTAIGDPAVAMYIDDISYADVYSFDQPLFDVERVEVLKGPQGTLYGKNTGGGIINIVTKPPTNEWDTRVRLETGDYNHRSLNAMVSGPLIKDQLFLRLSGLRSYHDGYIKNVYKDEQIDNQDTTSARGSLIYKPSVNWEIGLILGITNYNDSGGYPMVPVDKDHYESVTGVSVDEFEVAYNYAGESSVENSSAALKVKYQGDYFDVTSVTGKRHTNNSGDLDADFTPSNNWNGQNTWKSDAFSQEFRIKSKEEDSSLRWLLGLYYSDEKADFTTGYYIFSVSAEDKIEAELTSKNSAVFGQSTVRLINDKLGLTAGLRYDYSERGMDRTRTFGGVTSATPYEDERKTYSMVLPKAAIDFRFNEDMMIYFSAAKGYKAGGFSYAMDYPEYVEFEPEISTATELGFKSEFPDRGLRLNLAIFYTKVKDFQDRVSVDSMNVMQANAGKVDISGLETELTLRLTDSLTLNGILGITRAIYEEYTDPTTDEEFDGNMVAMTPTYNAGIFLDYRGGSGLFSRLELQNVGETYLDRENDTKADAYSVINVKAGYEATNWDIYLGVKNLTNKEYYLGGYDDPFVGYMSTTGDPRTIKLACNYRF